MPGWYGLRKTNLVWHLAREIESAIFQALNPVAPLTRRPTRTTCALARLRLSRRSSSCQSLSPSRRRRSVGPIGTSLSGR
jgi:hypothetical protein